MFVFSCFRKHFMWCLCSNVCLVHRSWSPSGTGGHAPHQSHETAHGSDNFERRFTLSFPSTGMFLFARFHWRFLLLYSLFIFLFSFFRNHMPSRTGTEPGQTLHFAGGTLQLECQTHLPWLFQVRTLCYLFFLYAFNCPWHIFVDVSLSTESLVKYQNKLKRQAIYEEDKQVKASLMRNLAPITSWLHVPQTVAVVRSLDVFANRDCIFCDGHERPFL